MRGGRLSVRTMLVASAILVILVLLMQPLEVHHFKEELDLLFPSGTIALKQRNLLFLLQAIMLLVIIPVYVLTFIFSWKYRSDNPKADYDPELVDNYVAEVFWWGIPLVLTALIAVITWQKTHELDPYKPLVSDKKPLKVQVVALQWKWLFIYPEAGVASVNFLQIPEETPIHFEITADAPMNSFWIPALGGQIYAMPSMKTELHLIATEKGDFRGASANLSGEGFAGMNFAVKATSEEDFLKWLSEAKASASDLGKESYQQLALPSSNNKPEKFHLSEPNLFDEILMKYMH